MIAAVLLLVIPARAMCLAPSGNLLKLPSFSRAAECMMRMSPESAIDLEGNSDWDAQIAEEAAFFAEIDGRTHADVEWMAAQRQMQMAQYAYAAEQQQMLEHEWYIEHQMGDHGAPLQMHAPSEAFEHQMGDHGAPLQMHAPSEAYYSEGFYPEGY